MQGKRNRQPTIPKVKNPEFKMNVYCKVPRAGVTRLMKWLYMLGWEPVQPENYSPLEFLRMTHVFAGKDFVLYWKNREEKKARSPFVYCMGKRNKELIGQYLSGKKPLHPLAKTQTKAGEKENAVNRGEPAEDTGTANRPDESAV